MKYEILLLLFNGCLLILLTHCSRRHRIVVKLLGLLVLSFFVMILRSGMNTHKRNVH
jgi:hypothetical protein